MVTNLPTPAFVAIQELSLPVPGSERDILARLQFPAAVLLAHPKIGPVDNHGPGFLPPATSASQIFQRCAGAGGGHLLRSYRTARS